ncbi:MAG: hypothetical protein ACREBW_07895 [Candidatus Micrarchaeaceae archaeon]
MRSHDFLPSYEGSGEVAETLASVRKAFDGQSAAAFLQTFSCSADRGAGTSAAEYMRQGSAFVDRLGSAIDTGTAIVYRTAPQVDTNMGEVVTHELFYSNAREGLPFRIFVEHTNFQFGAHIWYYNQHVLVRHGLTRLRISTQHHVVNDVLSGAIVLDDSKLTAAYETFALPRAHVTAVDCRNDTENPGRRSSPDVRFGFLQQEQIWHGGLTLGPRAAVVAAFCTASRKLQEVKAVLPASSV